MLRLPTYQELSEEQDSVYNMLLKGNHLVIGPPGSGKTVMAVYRANLLAGLGKKAKVPFHFVMLVYNRPLEKYLQQAFTKLNITDTAKTFHKWMWDWYRTYFRLNPPNIPGETFMPDWNKILANVANKPDIPQIDHLIVDEGQDLPRDFYVLAQLIAKNVTVFADENQRINPWNSTIEQIRICLRLPATGVLRLTKNYRNTRQIAEFAKEFYSDLQTGIPELPDRQGAKPLVLGIYGKSAWLSNSTTDSLGAQVEYVVRYYKSHPDERIGVAAPNMQQQHKLLVALVRNGVQNLHNIGTEKVDFDALDFGKTGITLLRYAHAKGLEFDAMFLPNLDRWETDTGGDMARMQFYVLTSRARKELFLMFTGSSLPAILTNVPEDLYRLRWVEGY
jgi:DNA helicase IV